ncbi:MAG: ATP-binding protein [Acidobacteria bacterium]|nr:ATP-binding protein [Acidobacteriota bacterium]
MDRKMLKRILKPPSQSFFLLGPRGTGKSTWLRANFPDAYTIDLLSEETYQNLLADPGLFANLLRTVQPGEWVIVDEVQRAPGILNEVHRFMENKKLKFALCGSSARKLKRAGVNLLAGRALNRSMHPFVPEELDRQMDIEDALRYGLLPIVWDSIEKAETLAAYAQLYLKEEVQAEALVRNLSGFARFLPIAALYQGQAVNVTNIAREAGVARTTVAGYLDILEETLLCFRLPAYEAKMRLRERKLPKWYWCDPGLVRAIKKSTGVLSPEEAGHLFEGLVAQLLRAYGDYRQLFNEMFYWAPSDSRETEVDFLLMRDRDIVAVEAKSGRAFSEKWCKGLRAIAGMNGLKRRIVVYPRGPVLRTEDGIDVMPFDRFASQLAADSL